jgi:hypothetical protein
MEFWFQLWGRAGADPRAFDTGSLDLGAQKRTMAQKTLMIIGSSIVTIARQPGKSVETELSLERRQLGMFEIAGKDKFHKGARVMNQKCSAMILPIDDIGEPLWFGIFHQAMQQDREGTVNTIFATPATLLRSEICRRGRLLTVIVIVVDSKMTFESLVRGEALLASGTPWHGV